MKKIKSRVAVIGTFFKTLEAAQKYIKKRERLLDNKYLLFLPKGTEVLIGI